MSIMALGLGLICVLLLVSENLGNKRFLADSWRDLRVRGPAKDFHQIPRDKWDAFSKGWQPTSGDDCYNGGKFNGLRYINPNDDGIALLFDNYGYIGGIQAQIPETQVVPSRMENPMYQFYEINGVNYVVITTYFIHPDKICNKYSYHSNIGPSSQVWFQNGPKPDGKYLKETYMEREKAMSDGWTDNNCIPAMGKHNFYEVEKFEKHNCTEIQPTCLLYNKFDLLIGFCLMFPGNGIAPSFEHPTTFEMMAVLGNTPPCLKYQADTYNTTTIHVYFTETPMLEKCEKIEKNPKQQYY